jgi:hypothetical protein
MGLFIWTSNDKLAWISILRVKSCDVFTTMVAVVDNCEESCLVKLKHVHDLNMEQVEECILVGVVLLDTPNCSKITLELHDLRDVGAFANYLVGGDGHGSELSLDGRQSLLLARRQLLLGQSSDLGGCNVCNANNDGEKGRSGEDGHDDDEQREIVRGDD